MLCNFVPFVPCFCVMFFVHTNLWHFLHHIGKWLGNRQIRCNWATKGAGGSSNEEKINDSQNAVVLTNGSSGTMYLSR